MDIGRVCAVLELPTEETIRALLDDPSTVFWVDWKEYDDAIADACDEILGTGRLSGELVEVNTDKGYEIYIRYGNRQVRVPLTYSGADRHITLCALNEALAPDYEVRFCIDSDGGDTLAFLPLPVAQWTEFERQYGDAVGKRFYRITARPNLFTDSLQF
jgi:hypothetical protein